MAAVAAAELQDPSAPEVAESAQGREVGAFRVEHTAHVAIVSRSRVGWRPFPAAACQRVAATQAPLAAVRAATRLIATPLPARSATVPAIRPPATKPESRQKR